MDSIADFVSKDEEIALLKKQVRSLIDGKSKWKQKYYKLKGPNSNIRVNRTNKAKVFVQAWIDGDKSKTFRQIANICFLSRETIKNISYKLQHNLNKE